MRQARNDILLILFTLVFYMILSFARQHHIYLPLVLAPAPDTVLSTPVAVTREP